MSLIYNPNGGNVGGGFNPPSGGSNGGNNKKISGNPVLITSTGGLTGLSGMLMSPYIDNNGQCFIGIHYYTNFNTEEACEYDYPCQIPSMQYQDGRDATWNMLIMKYRELGEATFSINIDYYNKTDDIWKTKKLPIKITNPYPKRKNFPDKRLHTKYITFVISGEMAQPKIVRAANAGPVCVTKLIICGSADEIPQL